MRRYAKDYEVEVERDNKGREKKVAVYVGELFDVSLDEEQLKKFRRTSMWLLGLAFAAQIAGGFVANLGMYAFFVALPYAFAFLPIYFLAMGVFRLPKEKRDYRREEVNLSFKRIKTYSVILLILASIGVIGEVVFLIWFANELDAREVIYLGLEVLLVALSAIWVTSQRDIKIIQVGEEGASVITGEQEEPEIEGDDGV